MFYNEELNNGFLYKMNVRTNPLYSTVKCAFYFQQNYFPIAHPYLKKRKKGPDLIELLVCLYEFPTCL